MALSLFPGPAVPSFPIQLHHGGPEKACGVGVEQSWPVSSRSRPRLETLHDVPVPQSGNSVFHLSPWTALQYTWEKGKRKEPQQMHFQLYLLQLPVFVCLPSTCVQCSRKKGSGGTLAGVKLEVLQTFWRHVSRLRGEEVSLHHGSVLGAEKSPWVGSCLPLFQLARVMQQMHFNMWSPMHQSCISTKCAAHNSRLFSLVSTIRVLIPGGCPLQPNFLSSSLQSSSAICCCLSSFLHG